MPKRHQIYEIYAPTSGVRVDIPSTILPARNQPDALDAKLQYGVNRKEDGTSLFSTQAGAVLGTPINYIFEANFPNSNVLQVFTHTGVYKHSSGSDLWVNDGQVFTGSFQDYWNGIMFNDSFIYTNGEDPMQYKQYIGATGTAMPSAITPTTYKAWCLAALNDHLCLYHLIENSNEYYKRVRWSKKAPLTFAAGTADFDSGTAGGIDLPDCQGEIKTALGLGAGVAVYSEHSIHTQFWVGGDEVFRFTKTIPDIGTPSRRGVTSFGDAHYFLSHDNIYAYYGGDDIRPIGDPIKSKVFSTVNNSGLMHAYVEYNDLDHEFLVHVPTGTATRPDTTYIYNVKDTSWSIAARPYTAYGEYTRKTGTLIGDLTGTIGGLTLRFRDYAVSEERKKRLYGDQSGRVVYVNTSTVSLSINGTTTAQTFTYVTPDIVGQPATDPVDGDKVEFITVDKRYQRFTLFASGTGTGSVYWSTNMGTTYTQFDDSPFQYVAAGTEHAFEMDANAPYCRFQVTCTGTGDSCGIKYAKVEFIPGGDD